MKVKGINKLYDVEIKKIVLQKKECVIVTAGNFMTGMTSVIISKEDWDKLVKAVEDKNEK